MSTREVKRPNVLPKALVAGGVAGLLATASRLALAAAEKGRFELLTGLTPATRIPFAITLGVLVGTVGEASRERAKRIASHPV